jgi:hypothetical protein
VNILVNEEKLKTFPLKSEVRQGSPYSSNLFDRGILELLARATKQKKEIQGYQIEKEIV